VSEKGTILIVEDRIIEKIGSFRQYLEKEGYSITVAENFKQAQLELNELLRKNTIVGIILDLSFPKDENDKSAVNKEDIPYGAVLFNNNKFQLHIKNIPIVINTTGDDEYKRKYLGDINNLNVPIYNVNHETNPLANSSGKQIKEILELFNHRVSIKNIAEDATWGDALKGKSVAKVNGKYVYTREGD